MPAANYSYKQLTCCYMRYACDTHKLYCDISDSEYKNSNAIIKVIRATCNYLVYSYM